MERTAVIYDGTAGERLRTGSLTVVGSDTDALISEARRLADAGWPRIELCGGVDAVTAARVRSTLGGAVRVGLNRYGFESLELIADYKRAFAHGEQRPVAFLIPAEAGAERVEHADVSIRPVTSADHVESVATELAQTGVGLIELYGGLGTAHAAAAIQGSGGRVPVGFVGYDD